MRFQSLEWSCGPAAIVNVCQALGLRVSESRVRNMCGSGPDGTDEAQLIRAVRELGFKATPHEGSDGPAAWAFVRSNVAEGRPCLLCIDGWRHWAAVVGSMGNRVIAVDSARTTRNLAENGVHSLSRPGLIRRWRCRSERNAFYAIAVSR